ncbi:MAG: glucose-6-phosphate isomerase, partial [Planctomycetota bacterium]
MAIHTTDAWCALTRHALDARKFRLLELMEDRKRTRQMVAEHDGVFLDYSRQLATKETVRLLLDLARAARLKRRIAEMASGKPINRTENRAVLHTALREEKGRRLMVGGEDVIAQVEGVRSAIRRFSGQVRSGKRRGSTGKRLVNVVAIGIGGSYLGPEFVAES